MAADMGDVEDVAKEDWKAKKKQKKKSITAQPEPELFITDHEIMLGTYEEFILGYKIVKKLKTKDEYELEPSFHARAHIGPVRSLVGLNKFVISGGSDEQCKVFDLVKRVEHGQLMHHMGTVSCLAGYGKAYLFSASDDNSLAVTRVGSWQVEKTLYKHQAGITALAVHPTGKIAFSAGKDKKLITWNLVKARPAFITNIKGIADLLVCSPGGTRYCVGLHRRIDVYGVDSAGIEYSIDLKCRPNCLVFLDENIIAVGGESPNIQVHSLIEKEMIKEFPAHETRVRCMQVLSETGWGNKPEAGVVQDATGQPDNLDDSWFERSAPPLGHVIATASSSDHLLKLWRIHTDKTSEVECIGRVDTTCRVTCMTTWNPSMKGSKKQKRAKEEVVESNTDSDLPKQPAKKIRFNETSFTEDPTSTPDEGGKEEITVEEEQGLKSAPKNPRNQRKKKAKNRSNFVVSEENK